MKGSEWGIQPASFSSISHETHTHTHSPEIRVCVCVIGTCGGSSDKPSTLRCHWTYPLMRSPRQVLPFPLSLSL